MNEIEQRLQRLRGVVGDRLHIASYLGHGAYGMVVKARTQDGRWVAVKAVNAVTGETGLPIDVIREAGACKVFKEHDNIVSMQQVFMRGGFAFLVFELCDYTLKAFLRSKVTRVNGEVQYAKPDTETLRQLFEEMLTGVTFMHTMGFLHRDIKPDNILLKNGVAKISDLGCARVVSKRRVDDETPPHTGGVVTLWYRPPEVLYGSTAYAQGVDAWSLGCVAAEMELGMALFPGNNQVELMVMQSSQMGTPDETSWPGVGTLEHYPPLFPKFAGQGHIADRLVEDGGVRQPLWYYQIIEELLIMNPSDRLLVRDALYHYSTIRELEATEDTLQATLEATEDALAEALVNDADYMPEATGESAEFDDVPKDVKQEFDDVPKDVKQEFDRPAKRPCFSEYLMV